MAHRLATDDEIGSETGRYVWSLVRPMLASREDEREKVSGLEGTQKDSCNEGCSADDRHRERCARHTPPTFRRTRGGRMTLFDLR